MPIYLSLVFESLGYLSVDSAIFRASGIYR